jgi:hypothetical protein
MQDMGHTGSELERLGMGTNQRCSSGSVVAPCTGKTV